MTPLRLLFLAVCALLGSGVPLSDSTHAAPIPVPLAPPHEFVAIADRHVCNLVDGDANVDGQDGSSSARVGDRVFWGFGDTYVNKTVGGPNQPNGLGYTASPAEDPAHDCVDMQRKRSGANAIPLLPVLGSALGECGAWPLGMTDAGAPYVFFFFVSVSNCINFAFNGIGLARVHGGQEPSFPHARFGLVWPNTTGLIHGAQTFQGGADDGYLYIGLQGPTSNSSTLPFANTVRIARVPATAAALEACVPESSAACAMEYWDPGTQAWVGSYAANHTVFTATLGTNGGAMYGWVSGLSKWMSSYTTGVLFAVRGRTSPSQTGPWGSEEVLLSYCAHFMLPGIGYCYTGYHHPEYETNGGNTIYLTMATQRRPNDVIDEYTVFLHEITLGKPVFQHANAANQRRYSLSSSAPAGFTPEGPAFYASQAPIDGFIAIHEWANPSSGSLLLGAEQPDAEHSVFIGTRFYAPPRPVVPGYAHVYEPVYRWDRSSTEHVYSPLLGLEAQGYVNMGVAFYTLCGDADQDYMSDCAEMNSGNDPLVANGSIDGDVLYDDNGNPVTNVFGFPLHLGNMQSVAQDNGVRRQDVDNCPLHQNPYQENSDSGPIKTTAASGDDITNPNADPWGDACDPDDDSDGLLDVDEAVGCNGSGPTDRLNPDTDGDSFLDGFECRAGSSPTDPNSRPARPPASEDSDRDGISDELELLYGSDPNNLDTDGDGLLDSVEIRHWGTDPTQVDTDADGCSDLQEAASVNGDWAVNSLDLLLIAQRIGPVTPGTRPFDVDRNGAITAGDLGLAASVFGPCFPGRHIDREFSR